MHHQERLEQELLQSSGCYRAVSKTTAVEEASFLQRPNVQRTRGGLGVRICTRTQRQPHNRRPASVVALFQKNSLCQSHAPDAFLREYNKNRVWFDQMHWQNHFCADLSNVERKSTLFLTAAGINNVHGLLTNKVDFWLAQKPQMWYTELWNTVRVWDSPGNFHLRRGSFLICDRFISRIMIFL